MRYDKAQLRALSDDELRARIHGGKIEVARMRKSTAQLQSIQSQLERELKYRNKEKRNVRPPPAEQG